MDTRCLLFPWLGDEKIYESARSIGLQPCDNRHSFNRQQANPQRHPISMKMKTRIISLLSCAVAVASYTPNWEMQPQRSESRRGFFSTSSSALVAAVPFLVGPRSAFAEEGLLDFQDADCGFTIKVPAGWDKTIQSLPDRRKIVLFIKPGSEQKTIMFLAYTPVRNDYTSLGSFGSVDEVAQATILPKSTLAGITDVESKMLSAESKKQAYFFDYITKVPQQPETHFRTIFSLAQGAAGGAGNVLVSITVQTPESEYGTLKPLFDKIMESYK